MDIKNPNEVRGMMEISDDELDMVAGGCGGRSGSSKSSKSSGSGKGKGKKDKGGKAAGISFTCPYCKKTFTVADSSAGKAHIISCPKNPNACG